VSAGALLLGRHLHTAAPVADTEWCQSSCPSIFLIVCDIGTLRCCVTLLHHRLYTCNMLSCAKSVYKRKEWVPRHDVLTELASFQLSCWALDHVL
jgi:hypothetical protein